MSRISSLSALFGLLTVCLSAPMDDCEAQSPCVHHNVTTLSDGVTCRVYFWWDTTNPDCQKDSSDSVSHACHSNLEADKFSDFESGYDAAMVQDVECGQSAFFGLKDGSSCSSMCRPVTKQEFGFDAKCTGGGFCGGGNSASCKWEVETKRCNKDKSGTPSPKPTGTNSWPTRKPKPTQTKSWPTKKPKVTSPWPTKKPRVTQTAWPTRKPKPTRSEPSKKPCDSKDKSTTLSPSMEPTSEPTADSPDDETTTTSGPTASPSTTAQPTEPPTTSASPTEQPTPQPSPNPTNQPSTSPLPPTTAIPTNNPTASTVPPISVPCGETIVDTLEVGEEQTFTFDFTDEDYVGVTISSCHTDTEFGNALTAYDADGNVVESTVLPCRDANGYIMYLDETTIQSTEYVTMTRYGTTGTQYTLTVICDTATPTESPSIAPTYTVCDSDDALNVAFLLDESGSIMEEDWDNVKEFVNRIITFDINSASSISLFEYASLAAYQQFQNWTINDVAGQTEIVNAMNNNKYNAGGLTYSWDAVSRVLDNFFDYRLLCSDGCDTRNDILFLLTDGTPTDQVCPNITDRVSQSYVDIVVIGIGEFDAYESVSCLDVNNNGRDVWVIQDFGSDEFFSLEERIRNKTCAGRYPATPSIRPNEADAWVYGDGEVGLGPVPTNAGNGGQGGLADNFQIADSVSSGSQYDSQSKSGTMKPEMMYIIIGGAALGLIVLTAAILVYKRNKAKEEFVRMPSNLGMDIETVVVEEDPEITTPSQLLHN